MLIEEGESVSGIDTFTYDKGHREDRSLGSNSHLDPGVKNATPATISQFLTPTTNFVPLIKNNDGAAFRRLENSRIQKFLQAITQVAQ